MEYCPHCMKPSAGKICDKCGGNMAWTAPPGQLSVGTPLKSPSGAAYMIGAAKGQGGFGITYAALNMSNGQRVAIKEYFPTMCSTRDRYHRVQPITGQQKNFLDGMKSFLEEAMMLSAVKALYSVVTVHDYFQANGTAYLVMEYVDGVPLHMVLQKNRMSAQELLPKLPRLLNDLDIMHSAGVIHRDIAPDNLMLMPDGSLKLLDFGSARSVQNGKSMTVLLKKGFSPVEQYQSKGQGSWTDVYALAATIYYCLTGVVPPEAISRLEKNKDPLVRPNQAGAQLSLAQENALLWGLRVQPKERPQTMREFAQKLCARVPAPPPPKPDPVPNSGQKPGPNPGAGQVSGAVQGAVPGGKPGMDKNVLIAILAIGGVLMLVLFILIFILILKALM